MRCGACGAGNPDGAAWCGQCYATLPDDAASGDQAPQAPASTDEPAEGHGRGDGTLSRMLSEGELAEGFRRADGTVEWECPKCGTWSAVEDLRCRACDTPLSARWMAAPERPTPDPRFSEPWVVVFLLSAVVPGAGHIGLRRFGTGIARAVLYAVWVLGAGGLLVSGGRAAGFAAAPLAGGALLLWVVSLLDLQALRTGRRELLGGRTLLWVVVAVTGLSILGVFAAVA